MSALAHDLYVWIYRKWLWTSYHKLYDLLDKFNGLAQPCSCMPFLGCVIWKFNCFVSSLMEFTYDLLILSLTKLRNDNERPLKNRSVHKIFRNTFREISISFRNFLCKIDLNTKTVWRIKSFYRCNFLVISTWFRYKIYYESFMVIRSLCNSRLVRSEIFW